MSETWCQHGRWGGRDCLPCQLAEEQEINKDLLRQIKELKEPLLVIAMEEAERYRQEGYVAVPGAKWHEILCSECSGWTDIREELKKTKAERDSFKKQLLNACKTISNNVYARVTDLEERNKAHDTAWRETLKEVRSRVMSLPASGKDLEETTKSLLAFIDVSVCARCAGGRKYHHTCGRDPEDSYPDPKGVFP